MHFLSAAALLLSTSFLPAVLGHNIQLPAHGRECFHEELHRDDKMTVTFQVGDREFGSAGNLDIDFWVRLCFLLSGGKASRGAQIWLRWLTGSFYFPLR